MKRKNKKPTTVVQRVIFMSPGDYDIVVEKKTGRVLAIRRVR